MAKFRDLERGTLGGRTEDFDCGGRVDKVRIVPLLACRDREIEAGAALYVAEENKRFPDAPPAQVKPGDPTYERGVYAVTVLLATFDPEDGAPYFASVSEIVNGLDRDRLALLFERQQQAQADFAPRGGTLSNAEFFSLLERTAEAPEGTDLPFELLPRATRRAFVRGMARLYKDTAAGYLTLLQEINLLRSQIASLTAKSGPGLGSPDTATSLPDSAASPSPTSPPGES
jgi:hypothetical protein